MAFCNISRTFGIFYNHMVHFVFIWYIFPVLVSCTKKNLASLVVASFESNAFETWNNSPCQKWLL
jgi:hypothetical protein